MATITRENIGTLTDKLTITISGQDYLQGFEQSLKKYAKTANIPGFRKGFVAPGVIKKIHGKNVFTEEVLKSVEKELNSFLENEKLEIFGQPLPLETDLPELDMNNPRDYVFSFEMGMKPVINIDLQNINVIKHQVNVTDAMINEEIENIIARNGKMTDANEITSADNLLNVTFTEIDSEGTIFENGINKGSSFPATFFNEDYQNRLMGKKVDDSIDLQLDTAFKEKEKNEIKNDLGLSTDDFTAENTFFRMTITKISDVEKPGMNKELFSIVFPGREIENEEDFHTAIKDGIQARWNVQSRNQLSDQIFHKLLEETHAEFPETFIKKWIQQNKEKPKTAEEAEKEYPDFIKSLKWSLISNQLIKQFDIKVSQDEIRQFAKNQVMGYMGMQNYEDVSWLDGYAESMLKEPKFMENIYSQLQTSKLFETLEGQVSVTEDMVSAEELHGMEHNHDPL